MGQEAQIRRLGGRAKKPSPPILSQEFIIQNHGDILSCVIVLVLAGFMFQLTSPLAQVFALPQYNSTDAYGQMVYTNGRKDIATILFYAVGAIVVHAVIQEYLLDKLQRRLHLSKTKNSKFNESGHLAIFALYSVAHAFYILNQANFLADLPSMYTNYPAGHREMNLMTKLFFLIQLAYWVHQFPEFYFAKVKKDEIKNRSVYTLIYLLYIGAAYAFNFTRVALVMLLVHFASESVYHLTRMVHFAEKHAIAQPAFKFYNTLFVVVRLLTIAIAFVTFWYGLASSQVPVVNIADGNFNTFGIRVGATALVCMLQVYFMWNFIMFHLKQMRERKAASQSASKKPAKLNKNKQQRKLEKEVRSLPEADQEHTRQLRSAKKTN